MMITAVGITLNGHGQVIRKEGFRLEGRPISNITSNEIVDIVTFHDTVWVATGNGLSRTTDNGDNWMTFTHADGLGKGSVTAFAKRKGIAWTATGYEKNTPEGILDAGGGLSYSTDDGANWQWVPQPVDSKDETDYKPTTTDVQNITYDIALTDSAVWITSFGGGLRKSTDMGETWQVVTVDGYPFDALGF
jgi:hypothetical protein